MQYFLQFSKKTIYIFHQKADKHNFIFFRCSRLPLRKILFVVWSLWKWGVNAANCASLKITSEIVISIPIRLTIGSVSQFHTVFFLIWHTKFYIRSVTGPHIQKRRNVVFPSGCLRTIMAATRFRLSHLFSHNLQLIGVRSSSVAAPHVNFRQHHVAVSSRRCNRNFLSKRNQGEWCQPAMRRVFWNLQLFTIDLVLQYDPVIQANPIKFVAF